MIMLVKCRKHLFFPWTQICNETSNEEKLVHDKELGINKKKNVEKKENTFHYIRKGQITFISVMSLRGISKRSGNFQSVQCKKMPHIKYH